MRRFGTVLVLLSACVACSNQSQLGGDSSGSAAGGAGVGGSSSSSGGDGIGGTGETYTVTWGPVAVAPGTENTQCVTKRVGNLGAIHVGRVHNELGSASHHLIVYTTTDTEEVDTPVDCQPFTDTLDPTKGSPVMVSQKADDVLSLPAGVGFAFAADQMVRLELHYINTTASEVQVSASSTFSAIPPELVSDEAGFLFIGNPDISIPPNSQYTVGPSWFSMPAGYESANFFAITGHTHQWGTNVTVAVAPAKAGPDTPVYEVPNWQWEEPETVEHDPPFQVPAGGGMRFSCQYDNKSSQSVSFGESANAEMCFFWAYFYPAQASKVCFHTDQLPGGVDMCCPGGAFCNQFF